MTLILVTALIMSCLAVLSATSQDKSAIISKLEELRDRVKAERPALGNKVNAVIHQIEAGAYNGALNKLQNDVKKSIMAWVDEPEDLIRLVDEIIDLIKGITPPPPSAPDFSISANPNELTIQKGDSDSSIITIASVEGFNQPVDLEVTSVQIEGVTASLNPTQITPPAGSSEISVLIIDVAPDASPGSYMIVVTGSANTLTHSTTISLEVVAPPTPPTPDFSVNTSPATLSVEQGDSAIATIIVASLRGFSQSVALAVTSEPISDVDVTIEPVQVTPEPGSFATSTLTVIAGNTATPNDYTLTVTGTSDSTTRTADISLSIIAEKTPPEIASVLRLPETPSYNQSVTILTSITDTVSGIQEAILSYSHGTTEKNVTMTLEAGGYTAIIPAMRFSTLVSYSVLASDNAGNWAASDIHSYIVDDPYPPVIGVPSWSPLEPVAFAEITINVTVSEPVNASGIDSVLLFYQNNTVDEWLSLPMALENGNWTITLKDQSDTTLKFSIVAVDVAGNAAESPEQEIIVSPPISVPLAWILAVILAIASVIGGSAYYVRRQKKKTATAMSSSGLARQL